MERWTGISSKSGCLFLENGNCLGNNTHFATLWKALQIRNLQFSTMNLSIYTEFHFVVENAKWKRDLLERLCCCVSLQQKKVIAGLQLLRQRERLCKVSIQLNHVSPPQIRTQTINWSIPSLIGAFHDSLTVDVCRGGLCCCGLVSSGWLRDVYITQHPWELHSIFYM